MNMSGCLRLMCLQSLLQISPPIHWKIYKSIQRIVKYAIFTCVHKVWQCRESWLPPKQHDWMLLCHMSAKSNLNISSHSKLYKYTKIYEASQSINRMYFSNKVGKVSIVGKVCRKCEVWKVCKESKVFKFSNVSKSFQSF